MAVIKRIVYADDLKRCLELIHGSFMTVAEEFGLTPENSPTNGAFLPLERLRADFERGCLMFGMYDGGKIVGFMQLTGKDGGVYELGRLAVLPACRHRGLGAEMLAFANRRVAALGGRKITAGIIEDNVRLKKWYVAHDFYSTGTARFPHLPFTVGFMETQCGVFP
ncbi:MAG: GNAT family N-acetyltransferase [Victivallaceae bacterium]|nr:GNAT family N-acetyltransferase [Victivallaceae bacterium]